MYQHISSIPDGSIIHFPNSEIDFMKVCDNYGQGGVVDLWMGEYISAHDLPRCYGTEAEIIAENLNSFYL